MEPDDQENELEPRRRRSCLWGCLTVLLMAGLVAAALFGYGVWYFYQGFENDARIRQIMAVVQSDPRAEMVLGRNIHIVNVDRHTFNYSSESGKKATYTLRLAGSDGDGELKTDFDLGGPQDKITLMVLTGSDGHPHYLVGREPKSPMMQSI